MDVGSLVSNRLHQHHVDQTDDRAAPRRLDEVLKIDRVAAALKGGQFLTAEVNVAGASRLVGIVLRNHLIDGFGVGDHRNRIEIQKQAKVVNRLEVVRRFQCDNESVRACVKRHWGNLVRRGGFSGKSINGFRGDRIRIKFDELHAGLPGQRVSDVMIGDETEFAKNFTNLDFLSRLGPLLLDGKGFGDLLPFDQLHLDEDPADAAALHLAGRNRLE